MGRRRSVQVIDLPRSQPRNSAMYERLSHSDHGEDNEAVIIELPSESASSVRSRWLSFAVGLCTGLLLATGVFTFVERFNFTAKPLQVHGSTSTTPQILTPSGTTPRTFTPNESFKLGADGSNDAWHSILPEGLGFVQHPNLGVEIVGLAFVHQLHCLDKLRQALDSANDNKPSNHHISHCIEYLRNSIMCNADANLEYRKVDPVTGRLETPGDGVHLCRGFEELSYFAEKWRVFDGKTASEKKRIKEDKLGRIIHYDYVSSRGDPVPHEHE